MSTKSSVKEPAKAPAADKRSVAPKSASQEQKLKAELVRALEENELLQLQLLQAQEELVEYFEQKIQLESKPATKSKADKDKLAQLADENAELKAGLKKLASELKQASQNTQQIEEMELLSLQLHQAQEELVEYFDQKQRFEHLYLGYKARWDRLEKRLPSYVDFGALEMLRFDNVADIPSLTWRIKEYAQAGVAIPELQFETVLHDGHPGIGLARADKPSAVFVPKLLTTNPGYLSSFLSYSASEYRQISAIVTIFEQLEASNWQGFEFPAHFDASFWRPSLKTLMLQLKALPPVLRYDDVVLKRELINPDYEHLWLEFRGLELGSSQWQKFEVRLGAALVQPGGFSVYPKFEFPLIGGKTKPFESWFAESYDDSGAKVELRFALDKMVFDSAVLAKLSDADRGLLLRIVSGFPDALLRLEAKKTAIHRPWATWIEFARAALEVLRASRAAAIKPSEPMESIAAPAKPQASNADPNALSFAITPPPAKTKLVTTVSKSAVLGQAKVLNFNSQRLAKPKATFPKPVAKKAKKA